MSTRADASGRGSPLGGMVGDQMGGRFKRRCNGNGIDKRAPARPSPPPIAMGGPRGVGSGGRDKPSVELRFSRPYSVAGVTEMRIDKRAPARPLPPPIAMGGPRGLDLAGRAKPCVDTTVSRPYRFADVTEMRIDRRAPARPSPPPIAMGGPRGVDQAGEPMARPYYVLVGRGWGR